MDVNGGEVSLRWINSLFNKLSAYLLIFNMFYTKQYFWTDLFLEFTPNFFFFINRSHWLYDRWDSAYILLIYSYGINKRQ